MSHDTIPYPLFIAASAQDRAEAGRRVADLMEHPGWDDLAAGVRAFQGSVTQRLMSQSPSQDAVLYADLVGELKGAAKIEPIAVGLVRVGEDAEAEIRAAEERGQD